MNLEIAQASFLSELDKIAEAQPHEEKKKLTRGEGALAMLGGPGGYFGAKKAREAGESAVEGAVRGHAGSSIGGGLGAAGGGILGSLAGKAVASKLHSSPDVGAAIGGAGGMTLGSLGGAVGGYKALTRKYNPDKTASPLTEQAREHISKKTLAAKDKASCMDSGSVKAAFALIPALLIKEGGVIGSLGKV